MLPITGVRLLRGNAELTAKFQSAKRASEKGAAWHGVQKGSRAKQEQGMDRHAQATSILLHALVKT